MKQIRLVPDPPFYNSVDVAVLDFPAGLDGAARSTGACVGGRRNLRVRHAVHLLHPEGAAVLVLAAEGASLLDRAHVGGYLV